MIKYCHIAVIRFLIYMNNHLITSIIQKLIFSKLKLGKSDFIYQRYDFKQVVDNNFQCTMLYNTSEGTFHKASR